MLHDIVLVKQWLVKHTDFEFGYWLLISTKNSRCLHLLLTWHNEAMITVLNGMRTKGKTQHQSSPFYIVCKRVSNARPSELRKGNYVAIKPNREQDREQPLAGLTNKNAKDEHSIWVVFETAMSKHAMWHSIPPPWCHLRLCQSLTATFPNSWRIACIRWEGSILFLVASPMNVYNKDARGGVGYKWSIMLAMDNTRRWVIMDLYTNKLLLHHPLVVTMQWAIIIPGVEYDVPECGDIFVPRWKDVHNKSWWTQCWSEPWSLIMTGRIDSSNSAEGLFTCERFHSLRMIAMKAAGGVVWEKPKVFHPWEQESILHHQWFIRYKCLYSNHGLIHLRRKSLAIRMDHTYTPLHALLWIMHFPSYVRSTSTYG